MGTVPQAGTIGNLDGAFSGTVQTPQEVDQATLNPIGSGGAVDTVTAADPSIVIGGTTVNPTVRTGTLDVIATQHPPVSAVGMNGQILTGLGLGVNPDDSVRVGQLPTALPPNGAAGGDLFSNYPNPTVVGFYGRPLVSTAPTSGQVYAWNGTMWVPTTIASGVTSYNTRTGAIVGQASDVETLFALKGQLFVGTGSAAGELLGIGTSGQVLTVGGADPSGLEWSTPASAPVSSVFGRTGAVVATSGDYSVAQVTGAAPLASPALTGTPTAPTHTPLTNNTDIATTAYTDLAVGVETTRAEAAEALALLKANNLSDVADAGTSRFNLSTPVLSTPAAVAVANVNIAAPGATLDGYTILTNDEILLTAQSTASQNGVWTWNGASSALTRPHEFPSGGVVKRGRMLWVGNGTLYGGTLWELSASAAGITIDTTAQTWNQPPYAAVGSGVTSFNTRTGAVTLTAGDVTGVGGMLTSTYDPAAIDQQVVGTTATQTLTNKTLTAPKIATISNTGALTLPTSTDTLVGRATTDTLTNKRITQRVSTTNAPGATPSMDTDNYDIFQFTGLATAITSMTTNLTGTPNTGDELIIQFTDAGTAETITWGSSFEASTGQALPVGTVPSALLTCRFLWNSVTSKWHLIATDGVIPGQILQTQRYAPTSFSTYNLTTTLAAIDTTNATLAFTVPASGIVDILIQCLVQCVRTSTGNATQVGLLNHTGGAQIGDTLELVNDQVASTTILEYVSAKIHLTSLTPGSLQVDLAGDYLTGTGNSGAIFAGGNASAVRAPLILQASASI